MGDSADISQPEIKLTITTIATKKSLKRALVSDFSQRVKTVSVSGANARKRRIRIFGSTILGENRFCCGGPDQSFRASNGGQQPGFCSRDAARERAAVQLLVVFKGKKNYYHIIVSTQSLIWGAAAPGL